MAQTAQARSTILGDYGNGQDAGFSAGKAAFLAGDHIILAVQAAVYRTV